MTQAYPLREQLKTLEQMQELDLKIDALKKKKASLPTSLKSAQEGFNKTKAVLDARKNAVAELEKGQRQAEAAIDLNKDRLARANAKLESVQNSQEFQAANKEIEQLKKLNGSLEEQIKKSKQDIEAAQGDVGKLTAQFTDAQAVFESKNAESGQQAAQLDSEIDVLMKERGQLSPRVEARILAQYDRVRVARAGVGIAPATGGRCSGCNMMVPPQLFNEIQKALSFHQCPSCHRILYVPQQSGEAGATK